MASDVQICNLALAKIGQTPILALSQNAPRAEKCNAVYSLLRDAELSEHNWKFAVAYSELTVVDEDQDSEYTYSFQLPSDYLKEVKIDSNSLDYRIVGDKLYTDADEISIEYIRQVADSGEFSAPFVDLLAARIAKELAWGITNNRTLSIDLAEDYVIVRRRTTGIDSQQGKPRRMFRNLMNESRRL